MRTKDVGKLKPGDKVEHKWFGRCTVKEVKWSGDHLFGVIILPDLNTQRAKLSRWTGMPPWTPFLEDNVRMVLKKLE